MITWEVSVNIGEGSKLVVASDLSESELPDAIANANGYINQITSAVMRTRSSLQILRSDQIGWKEEELMGLRRRQKRAKRTIPLVEKEWRKFYASQKKLALEARKRVKNHLCESYDNVTTRHGWRPRIYVSRVVFCCLSENHPGEHEYREEQHDISGTDRSGNAGISVRTTDTRRRDGALARVRAKKEAKGIRQRPA